MSTPVQLPTLPGMAPGIVGLDPLVQQCRACGTTHTATTGRLAFEIIQSGYRFHSCDRDTGRRLCPSCLEVAERECPKDHR